MQYYLFGFKHPTPENGSVFRQVPIPAKTIVNFSSVFDFSTFSVNLPAGSFNLDFSSFVITPVMSFAATQAYTAPAGFQSWAVGDTWSTPAHASLLTVVPATHADSHRRHRPGRRRRHHGDDHARRLPGTQAGR